LEFRNVNASALDLIQHEIWIAIGRKAGVDDDVFVSVTDSGLTRVEISENCSKEWHVYGVRRTAPVSSRVFCNMGKSSSRGDWPNLAHRAAAVPAA
jgi:hypothetical protein